MDPARTVRPVTRLGCWLTGTPMRGGGAPELEQIGGLATAAEDAGFDSLWVTDRWSSWPDTGGAGPGGLEAYSLLGALATLTRTVRLGAVPLGADQRPPSMVAKLVTTLDVISHGRGILTYGMASTDHEETTRATEALQIGRAMLDEDAPTFAGSVYAIDLAFNRPRPVQADGVPLVMVTPDGDGGAGLLSVIRAGTADAVIVLSGIDDLRSVVTELHAVLPRASRALAVIGVATTQGSPHGSSPHVPEPGPDAAQVVAGVRAVLGAGADGCLVPIDLTATPADVARIGAALTARTAPDALDVSRRPTA